jgi:hypothetical protein
MSNRRLKRLRDSVGRHLNFPAQGAQIQKKLQREKISSARWPLSLAANVGSRTQVSPLKIYQVVQFGTSMADRATRGPHKMIWRDATEVPVGWVDSSICYTSAPDWVSRACASNDSIAEEEADEAGKNADWENNRARALEQQTAFNLQRWLELQSDPDLAHLPHWIETDRYGHILIKFRLDTCVQVGDVL